MTVGQGEKQPLPDGSAVTPAERTRIFFDLTVGVLARALRGKTIHVDHSGEQLQITSVQPWTRKGNESGGWRTGIKGGPGLDDLPAGTVLAAPTRGSVTVVISAKERGQLGACVKIGAAKYNPIVGQYEQLKSNRELAEALGLGENDTGDLEFRDTASDTLYFKKEGAVNPTAATPEQAAVYFGDAALGGQEIQ